MKKRDLLIRKSLDLLCSFLIALAPLMLQKTNCILVWGEPKCPDDLKDLYSRN